jgi:hypothetical protein
VVSAEGPKPQYIASKIAIGGWAQRILTWLDGWPIRPGFPRISPSRGATLAG